MWWNAARFWSDMWDAGAAMSRNGLRAGEMAQASAEVIDSRTRSMLAACRDPLNGDYPELARMVPEKLAAFWEAGSASLNDIQAMQAAAFANWQQATTAMLSGKPLSAAAASQMALRSARIAKRGSRAAGKALAPVHSRATANARRLRKSPKR